MNRREMWIFATALLVLSVLAYGANLLLFAKPYDTFYYLLIDLGFLPISVLFVTVVVDRLLTDRERRSRQHKMNMVIGTFFSAVGQGLLRQMVQLAADREEIAARVALDPTWTTAQIREAIGWSQGRQFDMLPQPALLAELRGLLVRDREFMLRLLENPILLEHERFTDLLWAVFHLGEELAARESLEDLPAADRAHLAVDSERAYTHLLTQWLEYMIHLRRAYPFLYSFAARMNPLRPDARPEVQDS